MAPSTRNHQWQDCGKNTQKLTEGGGGADLTVMSLELLTVFGAGPLATYICYQIYNLVKPSNATSRNTVMPRLWFAAIVLATGELYGGFMTFAPEWLSGNTNLDTAEPIYLWLYLTFFQCPLGIYSDLGPLRRIWRDVGRFQARYRQG